MYNKKNEEYKATQDLLKEQNEIMLQTSQNTAIRPFPLQMTQI